MFSTTICSDFYILNLQFVTGALWVLFVKENTNVNCYHMKKIQQNIDDTGEKHLYRNLWKRREIRILCLT